MLNPGDIVMLGREASVQFAGDRAVRLRVISVCRRFTYQGWVWISGYELNDRGEAAERRDVFVRKAGVRVLARHPPRNLPPERRP